MTSFVPEVVQDRRQIVSWQSGADARQRPGAAAEEGVCIPFSESAATHAPVPRDPRPKPQGALTSSSRRAGVVPARDEQTNQENAA